MKKLLLLIVVAGIVVVAVVMTRSDSVSENGALESDDAETEIMDDGTHSDAMDDDDGDVMEDKDETSDGQMMDDSDGAVKEFVLEASNFQYSQSQLTVKKGDRVKITLKIADGFHDWRLEGYNIGTRQLGTGREEVLEFTADEAGTFAFFCSVGNHRALGMEGTLTVTQ